MKRPLTTTWVKWLTKTYTNPSHAAGYGGWRPLWEAARQHRSPAPSQRQVKEWLQSQHTYTLHKPVQRKFRRDSYHVSGIDHLWQADLSVLNAYQKQNNGNKYLLCVIDVFSKMAWVQPMKAKTSSALMKAFSQILRQAKGRIPVQLQTDKGTEFVNRPFQTMLKKLGIHFYTSQNPETKAAVVERFQRTLKNRMWRYFTQHKTRHYTKVLPQLMRSYNHSVHRTIGRRPVDVTPDDPLAEIRVLDFMDQKKKKTTKKTTSYLLPGNRVRISRTKGAFTKGYLPNWTTELFTVHSLVQGRDPPVYRIQDDHGDLLKGTFYAKEIQPVQKTDDVYEVDQILKRRKVKGQEELLVSWVGYPKSFNSWIPASHLL